MNKGSNASSFSGAPPSSEPSKDVSMETSVNIRSRESPDTTTKPDGKSSKTSEAASPSPARHDISGSCSSATEWQEGPLAFGALSFVHFVAFGCAFPPLSFFCLSVFSSPPLPFLVLQQKRVKNNSQACFSKRRFSHEAGLHLENDVSSRSTLVATSRSIFLLSGRVVFLVGRTTQSS